MRVKKGLAAKKHHKNLLKRAKGYLNAGSKKFRMAKERLLTADANQYKSRRYIKRDFRSLWIVRINGSLDQIGSELSYSKFIHKLKENKIELDRKSLSELAIRDIDAFKELVTNLK